MSEETRPSEPRDRGPVDVASAPDSRREAHASSAGRQLTTSRSGGATTGAPTPRAAAPPAKDGSGGLENLDAVGRVLELCGELVRRAAANPQDAALLIGRLERLLAPSKKRAAGGRGNRRSKPVLDPFEVHRTAPEALLARLGELDIEQLRDIVAHHGMDPRRLVMKWKDKDRVAAHIEDTVATRSRKGDAFRGSAGEPLDPHRPDAIGPQMPGSGG